jgi:hypothetical protein
VRTEPAASTTDVRGAERTLAPHALPDPVSVADGGVAPDGRRWVLHCAWCGRVRTADGRWDSVRDPVPAVIGDVAWDRMPSSPTADPPYDDRGDADPWDGVRHTHGICPPCSVAWRAAYGLPTTGTAPS